MGQNTTVEVANTPSTSSTDDNWFSSNHEDVDSVIEAETATPETPQPLTAPVEEAKVEANPTVQQPESVVAAPKVELQQEVAKPVVPEVVATPAQPQEPQKEPLDVFKHLSEQYAVSPEDAALLITSPEEVLPKLAANVHMKVMSDVMAQLSQLTAGFPSMIEGHMKQQVREQAAQEEVFSAWPGLRPHLDDLSANIMAIRKANPTLSRADLIELGALMTARSKGLDPATLRTVSSAVKVPTVKDEAPAPKKPTGLGSNANSSGVPSDNIFTMMSEMDDK